MNVKIIQLENEKLNVLHMSLILNKIFNFFFFHVFIFDISYCHYIKFSYRIIFRFKILFNHLIVKFVKFTCDYHTIINLPIYLSGRSLIIMACPTSTVFSTIHSVQSERFNWEYSGCNATIVNRNATIQIEIELITGMPRL